MKVTSGIMKNYHVEKIMITRGMEYPIPPLDWAPYEAIFVMVEGKGRYLKRAVDIKLCNIASPDEPVEFALIDTMQDFKSHIEQMEG